MGWRIPNGERYGFIRFSGEYYALTKLGFVFLRAIPVVALFIIWAVFIGD